MRWAGVIVAVLATAVFAATAQASKYMRVGIYDDAQTLYGPIDQSMVTLKQLHVQELRVNLYWGGVYGVAKSRPKSATSPSDPAYDWELYDRVVRYANQYGMRVLFTVYGTPAWANGGRPLNYAPTRAIDLRNFVIAAAKRYGGGFPDGQGGFLPPVKEWLAWNEPNNPNFLAPQYKKTATGWTIQSAADYVRICNAVYSGVHATLYGNERVACGVTGPRGNNNPNSSRPSVSPLAFLRAVKTDGLKSFDAWAHHPYYAGATDQPTTKPVGARGNPATAVTMGNFSDLQKLLTQLYGNKRIWITEYGYQTNPPDKLLGVSYAKQAAYLKQAFALARQNPRVDMMIWFLLRDEPKLAGWQSGLETVAGKKKPSFAAFMKVALASSAQ
ncbi:MAG TPA: DUF5722 domain-containing protein [Gaiellaceae bacterium]|jgi:hypothetical protein|nr:DUF5722 domain-containing protein [Gaiellaceae bacterium]